MHLNCVPFLLADACELTLDPNTAKKTFVLSQGDRQATTLRVEQPYPDHPDRFEYRHQVLCKNGLTGRCYWEVVFKGMVSVGLTYRGIGRKGREDDSLLGWNDKSWCYDCNKNIVWHNGKGTATSVVPYRVGVYLDWPAGTLSFYTVSSDQLTHLYTFQTTFTEPVYPAFRMRKDRSNSSVSLSPIY